jgi:tRNA-2-methylthio-N6-dimethylallyladenosine synthase
MSRPMDAIVNEVQLLLANGIREITLLGQIVNFYGIRQIPLKNGESPFVQLLRRIHDLDGLERLRFLSPHPSGFRDDLINCYGELSKLCPHVHLPIQSGSNRILRLMRRPYTREKVLKIMQQLRKHLPLISISTDLIVGFPTESDEDFQDTLRLFDEVTFDMAFVFKYSRRTGTGAALMDSQISQCVCEERNHILLERLKTSSLERNRLFLNSTQLVLVKQPSARDPNIFIGYTPHHKKTFFPASADVLGKTVAVKIHDVTCACLLGELLA